MGTVKYSGPVASFHCPAEATIRSLKVHFSPKQLGEGTPSPDNVREIVGWDKVEVYNYIKTDVNTAVIPSEYKKVEYLQNTGNAYLILNYIPNSNTKIIYKVHIDTANGNAIFCSGPTDFNDFRILPYMHTFIYDRADARYYCNFPGNDAIIEVGNNYCKRLYPNPATLIENEPTELTNMTNLYLFTASWRTSAAGLFKLYEFQVYEENELFINLIPCRRKSDNKPGMYDTVSQTFYTNAGTGEFICGPDVGDTIDYEFGILGKNKFDPNCDMWNYSVYSKNGDEITQSGSDGRGWTDANLKSISLKAGTYTLTCSDENNFNLRTSIDNYEANISLINGGGSFTLSQDCDVKIKHSVKSGNSYPTTFTVQLELGSTATTYEPYDPNKTVYGGWVDLVSGEVCEEYSRFTPDENSNITVISGDTYKQFRFWDAEAIKTRLSGYCSHFKLYANPNGYGVTALDYLGTACQLILQQDSSVYVETVADLKSWLQAQREAGTPFHIVFERAEPNYYHLPPHSTALKTFLSANNIWSNADYVEVEYDLHETQNILARKQFIMANQPHVVSPAAAPLQNFNTDMAAPLKECKVYFSPVQEGSGDPSPSNVRPITGWTGLTVYHSGENLYVPNENNKGYIKNDGTIVVDDHSTYTNLIPVVTGDIYSFKCTTVSINGSTNRRLHGYDSNGNWVSQLKVATTAENTVENCNIVTTIPSGISYIRVSFRLGDANPRVVKENAYEVNWNDSGTIYGGYIDLIKGVLVQEYKSVIFNGSESGWSTYGAIERNDFCATRTIDDKMVGYQTSICNELANINACFAPSAYAAGRYCDHSTNRNIYICMPDQSITTLEAFKSWLADNPLQLVYKLDTPIEYSLTPTQLKTLRGTNNIWSNSNGNLEIAYWKH